MSSELRKWSDGSMWLYRTEQVGEVWLTEFHWVSEENPDLGERCVYISSARPHEEGRIPNLLEAIHNLDPIMSLCVLIELRKEHGGADYERVEAVEGE